MTLPGHRPRLLVVDDLFGRRVPGGRNPERANLCAQLLLRDVTDEQSAALAPRVASPVADAVFLRGQFPTQATPGDIVENDLDGTLAAIRAGWIGPDEERWALVLVDLCFKTGTVTPLSDAASAGMAEGRPEDEVPSQYFGLTLLDRITTEFPELPVVVLSAQERAEVRRLYTERRGLAFLERDDVTPDRLRDCLWQHGLFPDPTGIVLGRSKPVLLALRQARQAANAGEGWSNILLRGETGSGKELFARFVNANSPLPVTARTPSRPFVVVDSSVLSPTLFESELFGHRRGAFTGAQERRVGLVVSAEGGDLFFDEIGNASSEIQAKLLRLVQERVVVALGDDHGRTVDVRFISATNVDIESADASFRADLLYRLREGGTIALPPLRERTSDIPLLAEHFVREAEKKLPGARRRQISSEAIECLWEHSWPGNVRELRSRLLEAVTRYRDVDYLLPIHLEIGAVAVPGTPHSPPASIRRRETAAAAGAPMHVDAVDELIAVIEGFRFDFTRPSSFSGKLPALLRACARMLARCLTAALYATRKFPDSSPDGKAIYTAAVKLATADPSMKSTRAADVVKHVLRLSPADISAELADPLLREALARAKETRRTKQGGKMAATRRDKA